MVFLSLTKLDGRFLFQRRNILYFFFFWSRFEKFPENFSHRVSFLSVFSLTSALRNTINETNLPAASIILNNKSSSFNRVHDGGNIVTS